MVRAVFGTVALASVVGGGGYALISGGSSGAPACTKQIRVVAAVYRGLPNPPPGGNGCWSWSRPIRPGGRCRFDRQTRVWAFDDYADASQAGELARCRQTYAGYPGYVYLAWHGNGWATNVGGAFIPELYRTGDTSYVPEYRRGVFNPTALQQWAAAGRPGSPMVSASTDALSGQQMATDILAVCRMANRGTFGIFISSGSFPPYRSYPQDFMRWLVYALNQCTSLSPT